MQSLCALSLTHNVNDWLVNSSSPRLLHVFDRVCNLINEHKEVLSIVTGEIGNGPFSLILKNDILFSEYLNIQSPVSVRVGQINLGDLVIQTGDAKLWDPRPNWAMLHHQINYICHQLAHLQISRYLNRDLNIFLAHDLQDSSVDNRPLLLVSDLASAIANVDIATAETITAWLAGLGAGLTPAGDDIIMGAIYAAWIIHPLEIAKILTEKVAYSAAPLTTSLSGAWLQSAGSGEVGILWHEFFDALVSADHVHMQARIDKILAVGETSGEDALRGFVSTLTRWAELRGLKINNSCIKSRAYSVKKPTCQGETG